MKRREFLAASAGLAGTIVPAVSLGQSLPCPQPTFATDSGSTSSTTCSAATLASDWQARISAPGVVWYHDFATAAEVNAFRWTPGYGSGNDPNAVGSSTAKYTQWESTDGVTPGCLAIYRQNGSDDGSHWWRPFSPLKAPGNGRTADDPGDGLAAQSYTASDGGSQISSWSKGVYGPSGTVDGAEYWLQMRVKIDPNRAQGSNTNVDAGKLTYQTICSVSNAQQELVTTSFEGSTGVDDFAMYCHTNNYSFLPGMPTNWQYPLGEWATVMYHVKPGSGGSNTLVEVWVAKIGQTTWTALYSNASVPVSFDDPHGYQALICSIYQNGENMTAFYQKFDQIIFSHQPIACPQV